MSIFVTEGVTLILFFFILNFLLSLFRFNQKTKVMHIHPSPQHFAFSFLVKINVFHIKVVSPPRPKMSIGGDISDIFTSYMYEWELGSRGIHIFIITFMKHIQFFILTENEKVNSSQTCILSVFI